MVRRIPTQGFGAQGPTPVRAGRIAGGPIVGDLYQRQLDIFVAESSQALAFAKLSLPGHSLFRTAEASNLGELRWMAKSTSGADFVGTVAIAFGLSVSVAVGVGWVSGMLVTIFVSLISFILSDWREGYLIFAWVVSVVLGIVGGAIYGANYCKEHSVYLTNPFKSVAARRDLRMLESFLNDPTNRESFFQAHPGEFVRFLKESVSQCFRDEQAGVRRTMDRLEAKMEEIRSNAAAEIRRIEGFTISDSDKEGLKETIRGIESRALQELGEAHERQKKLSEAIDEFMGDVNKMQVTVEGEMTRGDAYQGVAAFQRRVEEEVPGLVDEADASLREHVIDLHGYLEQLKEAADRLQALMAAELEVEQLLVSTQK